MGESPIYQTQVWTPICPHWPDSVSVGWSWKQGAIRHPLWGDTGANGKFPWWNRAWKSNLSDCGTQYKNPTSLELISAAFSFNSGLSPGNPVVELATSNGTINQRRERIKTDWRSKGGQTLSRLDEQRNPLNSGRTDRNWSEVFRTHKLEYVNYTQHTQHGLINYLI